MGAKISSTVHRLLAKGTGVSVFQTVLLELLQDQIAPNHGNRDHVEPDRAVNQVGRSLVLVAICEIELGFAS